MDGVGGWMSWFGFDVRMDRWVGGCLGGLGGWMSEFRSDVQMDDEWVD